MVMGSRKIMENELAYACGIHKEDEKHKQVLVKKVKDRVA